MNNFWYLDYHTEYSCEGDIYHSLEANACFSYVFKNSYSDNMSVDYSVILYKDTKLADEYHKSNACFLTKNQLENHLKQAQILYPFKFAVHDLTNYHQVDDDYNNCDECWNVYKVDLKLENVPGTFHKYLLTWLRYTYEFPYNVLLLDAYKLKNEDCFRFTSIANIFNLVLGCYCDKELNGLHQVPEDNALVEFLKTKDLREKLSDIRKLNTIYKALKYKREMIPESINNLSIRDIEYWNDNKLYEEFRKPIYLKTYKDIYKK